MLNQVVIVGRLVKDPVVETTENNKNRSYITIAVPRSYKNAEGQYDTDFVDCILWDSVASNTAEYCKKGDIIGVKGKVETSLYEKEDGEKKKTTQIVAEKVTFLSSSSKIKESDNEKSDDDLDM